jgi:transposase
MRSLTLTAEQRQQIEDRRRRTSSKRIADRLSALLWLDEGESQPEVAKRLDVVRSTVSEWVQTFLTQGLDEVCTLHYGGDPGELSTDQIEDLKTVIQTGQFRCARQIRDWIATTFQIVYSESGVKALLHRIGASYHQTTGFLWKADPQAQEQFVVDYQAETPPPGGPHAAILSMASTPSGGWNTSGAVGS